jgi:Family of unknown function (DUF6502)
MDKPAKPAAPLLTPNELHAPLQRILRPLVRLLIRSGVTYPALTDLLRQLYVQIAERDFALPGKSQTDSRVSLLTGIHRKEVSKLRGVGTPVSDVPTAVSRSSTIISRWLSSPQMTDADGRPLPLPRTSKDADTPSFESLVASVTRDMRPRAVLDEWLSQGLVTIDEAGDIHLSESAFVPRTGGEALAYYFGRNIHDHVAAAVANVEGDGPRFMERAVHYDGLTEEQSAELEAFSRKLATEALTKTNREASRTVGDGGGGKWRWIFGVYVFREKAIDEGNEP